VAESSTCVFREVKRGYRRLEGSIPLFSIAGVASFDARSAISHLDASGSLEPTTISGCENRDVLDFSRDRADEMDCWHVKKLVYRVDRDLRRLRGHGGHAGGCALPRHFVGDSEPRKERGREIDSDGATGKSDRLRAKQRLFESVDRSDIGFGRSSMHGAMPTRG
jgi:hypothetical protein